MSGRLLVAVLAGGEGRRIGGGKPRRMLGGETLLARALRTARRWSDEVTVVVREPGQAGDDPYVLDDPAIAGPLGGLAAALRHAREREKERLLTLPCDMPFVPADLAERLSRGIGSDMAAIAGSNGVSHPVCGLWRMGALDRMGDYLASGRLSLRGFADCIGCQVINWPPGKIELFFNINSTMDLSQAEDILRNNLSMLSI